MEELMNMIISDESPSQISDKIKDILFAKSAEKINTFNSSISDSIFNLSNDSE